MDLHYAARAVQVLELCEREASVLDMLWRAHVADKYVKRLKKLHPFWGDGSLRSVALLKLNDAEGGAMSLDLLNCIGVVTRVLAEKRSAIPDQRDRGRVCSLRNCAK